MSSRLIIGPGPAADVSGNPVASDSLWWKFKTWTTSIAQLPAYVQPVAPTIRESVAPTSGTSASTTASAAIGDLVIAVTLTDHSASPTHTLQGGWTSLATNTSAYGGFGATIRMSIAAQVAASAGVQSYTPYSASAGTSWTALIVLQAGTYDPDWATTFVAATSSGVDANPPSAPAVTVTDASLVMAFGAWSFLSSVTATITPPTNYTEAVELAGAAVVDLSIATREVLSAGTETPGAFADNQSSQGWVGATIAIIGETPLPPIEGTATVTTGAATSSAAATLALTGSAALTTDAATATAAGALALKGTAALTTGAATSTAAGALPIAGAAAVTTGAATVIAASTLALKGAAAVTTGAATSTASGVLPIVGASSVTLGDATLSADGTLAAAGSISGAAAITLDAATSTATGALALKGAAALTTGAATSSAAAALALKGASAVTTGAATSAATGALAVVGTAAVTAGAATATAAAKLAIAGTSAVTTGAATAAATAALAVRATASITLDAATAAGASALAIKGAAAITLGAATATGASDLASIIPPTGASIRAFVAETIAGLTPRIGADRRFVAYRGEGDGVFTRWAQSVPAAALRRFQVRASVLGDRDTSLHEVEGRPVSLEILVAYPQTSRFGKGAALDRDDAMASDQRAIERAVGLPAFATFAELGDGPKCAWLGGTVSRVPGDGVDFLVIRQTVRFDRIEAA